MVSLRTIGRNFIESQMIDTCEISRVLGKQSGTLDTDTGLITRPDPVTIYAGKCVISRILTNDRDYREGEMPRYANTYKMLIPADQYVDGKIGDIVRLTSTTYDERLLADTFTVTNIKDSTHSTYRRVMIRSDQDALGSIHGAA